VEALGAGLRPGIGRPLRLGSGRTAAVAPPSVGKEALGCIKLVMVAAQSHPLASFEGMIPRQELMKHVQLVLTDRTDLSSGREAGVISRLTWRLADLFASMLFFCKGWAGVVCPRTPLSGTSPKAGSRCSRSRMYRRGDFPCPCLSYTPPQIRPDPPAGGSSAFLQAQSSLERVP